MMAAVLLLSSREFDALPVNAEGMGIQEYSANFTKTCKGQDVSSQRVLAPRNVGRSPRDLEGGVRCAAGDGRGLLQQGKKLHYGHRRVDRRKWKQAALFHLSARERLLRHVA